MLLSVLQCERPRFYPTLPIDQVSLEAPKDLCVPKLTILAVTGRRWVAPSRDTPALAGERNFLDDVLPFERLVFALLCLLHAT